MKPIAPQHPHATDNRNSPESAADNQRQSTPEDWEVIFAYSRAQAIADGVLVDVTWLAQEAGFKYPVAMTSAAWAECVAVPEGADDQDEAGRLWDVLSVLRFAIRSSANYGGCSTIRFQLSIRTGEVTAEDIELKSVCGPGDDRRPVITIMLPEED